MSPRRSDHAEIATITTSTNFTVEFMRAWYSAQEFARHEHPYLTVGVVRRGIGTLWAAGVTHVMRPGDVVVIPSGEVHTGGLDDRGGMLSYMAVHAPAGLVAQAAGRDADAYAFPTLVIRDEVLANALARVDTALRVDQDPATAEAAIVAMMERVVRRRSDVPDAPRRRGVPPFVHIARSLIDDCYADHACTSLGSLSTVTNVSQFHLAREFKRATGLSPHQYVVQTRVRRAAQLLATGTPISAAAATVGFVDQAHLTTHFRRHLGMTPGSWQKSGRAV
jgi:AraC-like DNA-binding protein/mannose-6-phosphate isomerase-like protein (cupin superfamily)